MWSGDTLDLSNTNVTGPDLEQLKELSRLPQSNSTPRNVATPPGPGRGSKDGHDESRSPRHSNALQWP